MSYQIYLNPQVSHNVTLLNVAPVNDKAPHRRSE